MLYTLFIVSIRVPKSFITSATVTIPFCTMLVDTSVDMTFLYHNGLVSKSVPFLISCLISCLLDILIHASNVFCHLARPLLPHY